ncbi:N-acetylmuramoyl-L-alanine amidase [Capnocytophaga canimorsus]|uniref:N-acetylmuramoyl-L-alanine amidase n=1 Tax=Capnocytophaga canimorsus TaxID=28188 RepID=UPI0037D7606A
MRKPLLYLVIHCTATPEGREVSSDEIRKWHLSPQPQGRGWKQVGYTDMIHLNGAIERLVENNEDPFVDGWEITNGAKGINSVARHIVYVGGSVARRGNNRKTELVPADTRTPAQREALAKFVRNFVSKNPNVKVAGHNQFANKACPSFDVPKWLRTIGIPEKNIYK